MKTLCNYLGFGIVIVAAAPLLALFAIVALFDVVFPRKLKPCLRHYYGYNGVEPARQPLPCPTCGITTFP